MGQVESPPIRAPPPDAQVASQHRREAVAQGTLAKAQQLQGILANLEVELANATDLAALGDAYRSFSNWAWVHRDDEDLDAIMRCLDSDESMYPAWRRQALEEAYILFYEESAKQRNKEALEHLPRPPTSAELGFRRLPLSLTASDSHRRQVYSHAYEEMGACCHQRKWDYDIRRNKDEVYRAAVAGGVKRVPGREITLRDNSARYCACATESGTLSFVDFCCAGRSGPPEGSAPAPEKRPRDRKGEDKRLSRAARATAAKPPPPSSSWQPPEASPTPSVPSLLEDDTLLSNNDSVKSVSRPANTRRTLSSPPGTSGSI
eukprot:gnl/TRDRNA2_/TRDRNA2_92914_c0_seq2.p1 gnl/TRDRNA2_/TRDRNA2_92914_c0~~gnl/TRDRNA2_/TRDRNA2_92914_c0_seq2.p1  ORF type:complete len:319 (+),score=35.89 gnl/TRDRNA2_/TRDRNA2_92914_c0_seq2:95-1051(+)